MKNKFVFPVAEKSFIRFGSHFDKDFVLVYWRLPRLCRFVSLATYLCFMGGDINEHEYDFFGSLSDYVGFDLAKRLNKVYEGFLDKYTHMNQRKKIAFWLGFINSYQKQCPIFFE